MKATTSWYYSTVIVHCTVPCQYITDLKVLKKYLKDIGEQKTYMQSDQRVVSKDDNKNKTKTKEQAAVKSNHSGILKHS